MKKLAIVTSHPIQYNAPLFKLLTAKGNLLIKVFYTWGKEVTENKFDPGFDKIIHWDIPLLEGYDYSFVKNIAPDPGTHHFKGIINPGLNSEIETFNPAAILVFGWGFHSHLKCLRYFHNKIPVLFRGDSTLLDERRGIKKTVRRLFLKWVYRHVDFALYVGSNNKKYFIAHGLQPAQLIYAPHAVDNDRFAEPDHVYQQEAIAIRTRAGIKPQDLVLLFAGKLEVKKNPLFLISLLKTLKDERLKLLIVGSGPLLPLMRSAAATDERIVLMGFENQQQMPVIYRLADLVIMPSSGPGETWGLALNEAMASGKAVVATCKTGGAVDLIDEGVNGMIIDTENTFTLQNYLQRALNDQELLREMGRQSAIKIQSFTFNHIVNAIEDVMALTCRN